MTPLTFTEWDSAAEMLDKLRDKSLLRIGAGAEGVYRYFSVDLPPERTQFGIVMFSNSSAGPAGALVDESRSKAVIGYDSSVVNVDIKQRVINYHARFPGIFYEFLRLDPSGACIVLHQIGVVSICSDGTFKWSVDTGLIQNFVREGDEMLHCTIMDERPVTIDLRMGTLLQSSDSIKPL
jgi:hypothetical protein